MSVPARIFRSLAEFAETGRRRRGIALGVFDGVHAGHRRILGDLVASSDREGLDATLAITFHPHPLSLVRPERAPALIMTVEERVEELAMSGVDEVLLLPFTRELAETEHERFAVETLVGELGLALLVVGYDFHFGKGRRGTAESMAALGEGQGFKVKVITPCYEGGRIVSSTHIRESIAAGKMEAVRRALGRPYLLSGEVVRGKGLGTGLGVPTANLSAPPADKLLPPCGVYLASTRIDGIVHSGLLNLGWAPTLRGEFGAELHLIDFSGSLLGKYLQVELLQWFRPERHFSGAAALLAQIGEDLRRAREILAAGGSPPPGDGD